MKSLKGILTAPDKKLRLDTLNKCEDVLHKLYEKVEGPPPVSSTTVSVSGMFYKQWLIRNGKENWLTLKKAIKLKLSFLAGQDRTPKFAGPDLIGTSMFKHFAYQVCAGY